MTVINAAVHEYLVGIGRKGGSSGTGQVKARSHDQAVAAGKAGAAKRWSGHVKAPKGKKAAATAV